MREFSRVEASESERAMLEFSKYTTPNGSFRVVDGSYTHTGTTTTQITTKISNFNEKRNHQMRKEKKYRDLSFVPGEADSGA